MVAIHNNQGQRIISYSYDAWGNPLSTTGTMATTLGALNPLRYRGYVYDQETGLYYLQSRYYNPEVCRFINADGYTSTGQGFTGNNTVAYCSNNPVANSDHTGMLNERTAGGGAGGGYVGSGYSGGNGLPAGQFGQYFPSIRNEPSTSATDVVVPLVITTTYAINELKVEKIALKRSERSQVVVTTELAKITRDDKKPVIFPENPLLFQPSFLLPIPYAGSYNGPSIKWFLPGTKVEVFRWDANCNHANGPHYHIHGAGHFYPGSVVPEPWASFFFWHVK